MSVPCGGIITISASLSILRALSSEVIITGDSFLSSFKRDAKLAAVRELRKVTNASRLKNAGGASSQRGFFLHRSLSRIIQDKPPPKIVGSKIVSMRNIHFRVVKLGYFLISEFGDVNAWVNGSL